MSHRVSVLTLFSIVSVAASLLSWQSHTVGVVASAAAPGWAGQEPSTSTLDDQTELAVTVYNSDLALVRDVRNIRIGGGVADLRFMDIAATVNPASVHFRSLTDPARVTVLEQNYEYDLLEPDKLLRKYVGRDVTLVQRITDGRTMREEAVTAHLLSYNAAPVWRIGNEIVTGIGADHIRFPELPGNLYARPTLIWTLENKGGVQHRVEASYLATKLGWNADYVLTVARDDKTADIDGWVTVHNNSGTAFPNARLQLVAGELNRVSQRLGDLTSEAQRRNLNAAVTAAMTQESLSDYHLYTLDRKTTIGNNQTKQVSMLNATHFPVRKRYVVDGQSSYYRAPHSGETLKDAVEVLYEVKNDHTSGLGMPMPAGVVRVYQADSKGDTQFVGEDRIDHTPKDGTLNLRIGTAFDVTTERRQTDFQRISNSVSECEYEVTLENHKTTPVTVEVNEPIDGTWRMLRQSHPWTKTSASTVRFSVRVPVDGVITLSYRVRVSD